VDNEKTAQSVSLIDRVWKFFSSITLAVVVFALISLTSIIGTIIEQGAEPQRNIKLLAKFVGPSAAPKAFQIVDTLGFTDMYHSWWFVTMLFVFATNLIVCSLERLPGRLKVARERVKPLTPEQFPKMPIRREVVLKDNPDKVRSAVEAALKKAGFTAEATEGEQGLQLFAERGRYGRLGVYVTHLSILIIMIGAVAGIFFGFNASLNLLEGTASGVAYRPGGKEIPLSFLIRCDDFSVSFYEGSDTPKSYRSVLTVMENGKDVLTKEIEVNEPLKYKGITFYQSSYGFSPTKDSLFRFSITSASGSKSDVQLKFGESFAIPGTSVMGKIADFSPALGMDDQGRLFTYADMMQNPAVFVEFSEGGAARKSQWILTRIPETWKTPYGTVEFKDLWGAQYTGLQVRKDPGVWLVYLGCLIMAIGLYAAFFMGHSRVWVLLRGEKNTTKVTVAAAASKARAALDEKIEKVMKSLGQ
jgi:cytochrome c biogenesis protein